MEKNLFQINDVDAFESFKSTNPTKDDYYDIVGENDPEFLNKINQSKRSSWDDENQSKYEFKSIHDEFDDEFDEKLSRYSIEIPDGYEEIELYDHLKTFDENFEHGKSKKHILIEVDSNKKKFEIKDSNDILASPQSKCLVDIEKTEDHSLLQFIPIDYDTFWGVRLKTFVKYQKDFFLCDERVMFESILYKYKAFDFKPFYWSKEVIFDEIGIKKDRATKILLKFISLGILTKKLVKSKINNKQMQINYYDVKTEKILELVPKIYQERDDIDIEISIKRYLSPVLKK